MELKNDEKNENHRDKISSSIGFSLSPTRLETSPGQPVEATLKIRNLSVIVDRFHIKIEGLDPTWWTLSIPTFACFPGDICESKLTVQPPKEAESIAGGYSFRVKVVSEANPQEEAIVAALLVLRGFVAWDVEISPTRSEGRRGTYRLTAHNSGNSDAVLLFEGKDAEEALMFNFDQSKVSVPAGGTKQVKLDVYPKNNQQQKLYNFQISARHAGQTAETKMSIGQLEYIPKQRFPWWLLPAILGAIGIILIGLGIAAGAYETTTLYVFSSTPYKGYMAPLMAVGAVLVGVAVVMGLRNKKLVR
jgi:uncharacterized membrane protein